MNKFPNNDTRFKKGQSGNPKGRPKKTQNYLNDELIKKGFEPVKRSQVVDCIEILLGLPLSEIIKIAGNPKDTGNKYTALMRITAKELLGKRSGQFLNDLLDRVHGKPTQAINMRTREELPDLSGLSEEDLEALARIYEKLDNPDKL